MFLFANKKIWNIIKKVIRGREGRGEQKCGFMKVEGEYDLYSPHPLKILYTNHYLNDSVFLQN